jgi:long-chain acyl-CoA synthetase
MIARNFFENARRLPGKVALEVAGVSLSYARLAEMVSQTSRDLERLGVKEGQRIAVDLPNDHRSVGLLLAAADLGVALVPLNPGATERDQRAACVATQVHRRLSINTFEMRAEAVDPKPGTTGRPDDAPFLITTTSGSTGDPKPVLIDQAAKMRRIAALVRAFDVTEDDVVLVGTPMHHSLAQRMVLLPLTLGGTAILSCHYTPKTWAEQLTRATFCVAVPTQIQTLLEQRGIEEELGRLRYLVSSSAPMPPHVKHETDKLLGRGVLAECYGTTEIAVATVQKTTDWTSFSVGEPLPGVDVRIISAEGEPVKDGERGEIVCRTPYRFNGYFNLPMTTAAAFWKDGYFKTGDLGHIGATGYLYVSGRLHDIIKTGGISVHLHDVERAVMRNPSLIDAAAFPVPDRDLGEVAGIAVVPRESADLRAVKYWCAANLDDDHIPRRYVTVREIPRSATGKTDRKALTKIYQETTT